MRKWQMVKVLGTIMLLVALVATGCERREAKSTKPAAAPSNTSPRASSPPSRPMPPYYESAEAAKPFPALVPPEFFGGYPLVERAYRIAAKMPAVIAQQPCYCYCDKFGHHSLLDCYTSDHGAG